MKKIIMIAVLLMIMTVPSYADEYTVPSRIKGNNVKYEANQVKIGSWLYQCTYRYLWCDDDVYKVKKGHVVSMYSTSEDQTVLKLTWKGKKLKSITYYLPGKDKEKTTFKCDKKGNPKSATSKYYSNGKLYSKMTYKYKNYYKKGKLVKRVTTWKYNGRKQKHTEKFSYKTQEMEPKDYKYIKPCIEYNMIPEYYSCLIS